MDSIHVNESRIYRELTAIEKQKEKIEQWLYQTLPLIKNVDLWKQQFNFSKIILVFDRGMVSDENLQNFVKRIDKI
jgi:hypothetical protein